ncbi:MAG: dephospho-CoA kinase [Spirochaetaceae bacterium]|nr:dephospho-CoA kinase [Spirochaetaceae bacterium]
MSDGNILIGLTGLSCSGKNYLSLLFEKRGFAVLDADKLAHTVLEDQKEFIISRWGTDILDCTGTINRKALGKAVFGKKEELSALEGILYPRINEKTLEWIAENKDKSRIINAAVLHKSVAFEKLDCIVIVKAPYLVRLFRAKSRGNYSFDEIIKRFKSQKKFNSQYFGKNADTFTICNGGIGVGTCFFRRNLEKNIDKLCLRLKKISENKKVKTM